MRKIFKQKQVRLGVVALSVILLSGIVLANFSKYIFKADSGTTSVVNLTTNLDDYTDSKVPKYEKLELTFDINRTTTGKNINEEINANPQTINPYWPYDEDPTVNQYFRKDPAAWDITNSYAAGDEVMRTVDGIPSQFVCVNNINIWKVGTDYAKETVVVYNGVPYKDVKDGTHTATEENKPTGDVGDGTNTFWTKFPSTDFSITPGGDGNWKKYWRTYAWDKDQSYNTTDHVLLNGKIYSNVKSYSNWTVGAGYTRHQIVSYNGTPYELQWRNYWDSEMASDGTEPNHDQWHGNPPSLIDNNRPDTNPTWSIDGTNMQNYHLWQHYQWTLGDSYIDGSLVSYNGKQYVMQGIYDNSGGGSVEEVEATADNAPDKGDTWSDGVTTKKRWVEQGSVYNTDTQPGVDGKNWQEYWQPYENVPVTPGIGITVNAYFTGPDGKEITPPSPAFYYQDFKDNPGGKDSDGGQYPKVVNGKPVWKVRFTPRQVGNYTYRIEIKDKSGTTNYSSPQQFASVASDNRGFVRVSPNDNRYFETTTDVDSGGQYLNTVALNSSTDIKTSVNNGVNVIRPWWAGGSASGIFGISGQGGFSGSYWHGEYGGSSCGNGYCDPLTTTKTAEVKPGSLFGFKINGNGKIGVGSFGVEPSKNYKVAVTYKTSDDYLTAGGDNDGFEFGADLNGPTGWEYRPIITGGKSSSGWQTKVFDLATSNQYEIGLDLINTNVTAGSVFIDSVSVKEVLSDASLSSEIVIIPDLNVYKHFPQYKLNYNDGMLADAEKSNVYESIVLEEKADIIYSRIQADGTAGDSSSFNSYGGFGNHASRTYQEYYWRYFIARYGYSTNIFDVEFCNEGDPFNGNHTSAVQDLTTYFHLNDPNNHLATGSNWHSFPVADMWSKIDGLDLAQVHNYVNKPDSYDTAAMSENFGKLYGSRQSGLNVPTVVGETGINRFSLLPTEKDKTNDEEPLLNFDSDGTWFRKLVWGQMNPFGTVVQYWWNEYIEKYDLYRYTKAYTNFMKGINLASGKYGDISASTSTDSLRAWGQKEIDPTTKKADKAHLWIDNAPYTWKAVANSKFDIDSPLVAWNDTTRYYANNVVKYNNNFYKSIKDDGSVGHLPTDTIWWTASSEPELLASMDLSSLKPALPPHVSGTVIIPDMKEGSYNLEWWDTSTVDNPETPVNEQIVSTATATVDGVGESAGKLTINVRDLPSDIALKITLNDATSTITPTPTSVPLPTINLSKDYFSAGYNMISFPNLSSNISSGSLLPGIKIRKYNGVNNTYIKSETNNITLTPGEGYWIKFDNTNVVTGKGYPLNQTSSTETPVNKGWNILGNPFQTSLPLSNLSVKYKDGTTRSYSEAISRKEVAGYVWSYEGSIKQYIFIAINPDNYKTASGITKQTTINPFRGFWTIIKSDQVSSIVMGK